MTATKLKPLTGKRRKRNYLVWDIESKHENTQRAGFTRPFMAGVLATRFHVFTNYQETSKYSWKQAWFKPGGVISRTMKFMLRPQWNGYYIYAHNGGRFDLLFLLPWLMEEGRELGFFFQIVPVMSSIQILTVYKTVTVEHQGKAHKITYTWTFLDSLQLIRSSLNKAAETFGLDGKLKHDLNLHESDPRWVRYLEQDCQLLMQVLEKFHYYIEEVLCGEVGLTAPSTAMKTYRRSYMTSEVHRNVDTHEFVRMSYCGGRTEAIESYGEELSYYDINSSYPASMLRDMPGGPAIWCHGEPSEQIKRTMIGFVRVDVELPTDLHIPPLPLKGDGTHGPKGKLIFPVGKLTGIWEWEELQLALEVGGHIQHWYESVWYEPVPMFVKYVNRLWSFRDKTRRDYDPTLDAIAKSLLNSLYGKFGQKLLREKYWHRDDPKMPMALCKPLHGDDLESLVWKSEEEIDSTYIIPQVAARVTALSRIRLYRGFQEIQRNGGRVYYCDTDSIVAHGEMQTGLGLGEWKDEHPEYHAKLYGGFYGPKFYTIWAADGWRKVRAKGVQPQGDTPQCREQNLFDQFTALASGRSIVTKRLEKVGSLGRVQFQRGPKIVTVPRTLRNANPKRKDLEDGRTKPYELNMW